MKRVAIITGVCGQDGSYLTEYLLAKDYKVFGVRRRNSTDHLGNVAHLVNEPDFEIVEGDVTDYASIYSVCRRARADEFYNLAAQSHVGTSFGQPTTTVNVNGLGVLNCLEAIRMSGVNTKFYQASTSEMFGGLDTSPTNETTPFHPRSPYGCAKLFGYWQSVNYREAYKMFVCNGILHNHESPRRGPNFVTRKITIAVAKINAGQQQELRLGAMNVVRDWSHAYDMVAGMWKMMQAASPSDYVLASGVGHSVQDFCEAAFKVVGKDWKDYVRVDHTLYRPAEVPYLVGDATKARTELNWMPFYSFDGLVKEMVEADIKSLELKPGG